MTTVETFTHPRRSPTSHDLTPALTPSNSNELWLIFRKFSVENRRTGAQNHPLSVFSRIRLRHPSSFIRLAAASTSAAWPSTLTLRQMRAIRPSAPISKVVRVMPMKVLPYIDFLPQTP